MVPRATEEQKQANYERILEAAAARRRKEQMEDCDKKKRSDQQLANDRLSIKETGA